MREPDDELDLEVVSEAGTAHDAVALAAATAPDVFVIDLGLPDTSGIAATREVKAASKTTKVLVLAVHDDVAYLRKAFGPVPAATSSRKPRTSS